MQEKINELKDYAELAQASYFYFDLEDCILQENETIITLNELLNLSYNGKIAGKKEKVGQKYSFISKGELNGEFGELQTKNFIQRYEVQFHQPNTTSGFSATLFYDKQKDEFIVGFRGTEGFWNIDTMQDITLSLNGNIQSSVYGWNFPNIAINPNTIKIMQDLLGKYTIDVSEKITHIYDNGKIEIIASAQYGASNALGIYTGKNDHSIKPLVNTLYFYSYLLELDANYNKVKDKSLSECIEYLNHFMKNIQIYTETFVLKNNAINNKNFALKNGPLGLFRSSPEKINHFEYFLSLIATIMQETNGILEELGDGYYTSYKAPTISQTKIIDFILKAQEKEKYILILDKNDFNKYRKDCSFINNQENLAHKIAIGEFRIFIVVYKDMKCLENINNITKIYRYNSKSYKIKDQIWDEQYLGGVCKISQALYFNGKAKIGII